MTSGKRSWSEWDTELHYAEQAIAAMRVAALVTNPLRANQQRGMAMDAPASITMPQQTWNKIAPGIACCAELFDLDYTVTPRYHEQPGNVRISFARRRGKT